MSREYLLAWVVIGTACSPAPSVQPTQAPLAPAPEEPVPAPASIDEIRRGLDDALTEGPGPKPEQCAAWTAELRQRWKHPGDWEPPADPGEAALLAGEVHRACDDPDAATAAFLGAIHLGPRWITAAAWVGRANLELDRGDAAAAERHLRRALELDPKHPTARLGLTRLVIDRYGRDAEPEAYAEAETLARSESDPWMRLELARLLLYRAAVEGTEAGEMHLVLAHLRHEDDPALTARVLLLTGLDHERNGEVVAATRAFAKAVELDPNAAEAWAHLGLGHLEMRGYAEALEALSHAQQDRRFAERPDILRARAVALMGIRRLDGARLVYERLLELEPLNPANALGLAALAERRAAEAADRYERERHLADAALYYRELIHMASGDETDGVDRARTFLHSYGTLEPNQ